MQVEKSFIEARPSERQAVRTRIMFHKFKIGQLVGYRPPRGLYAPPGKFSVTALLPERNGDFEYRIRHPEERHERVVRESELQNNGVK